MAAPSYYDNIESLNNGSIADADDVEDKFTEVESAFDLVEADMDNTLRFTSADFSDQTSAANAATRANKVVGFDSSGDLALLPDDYTVYDATDVGITGGTIDDTTINGGTIGLTSIVTTAKFGNVTSSNVTTTGNVIAQGLGVFTDGVFGTTSTTEYLLFDPTNLLKFYTNSTERLRIDASGNVDIVTGALDLSGSNITDVGAVNCDSLVGAGDPDTNLTFAGSDVITVTTGGSERMRITASGDVCIGTVSPGGYKMNVDGEVFVSDPLTLGGGYGGEGGKLRLRNAANTTVAGQVDINSNDDIRMFTVGATRLLLGTNSSPGAIAIDTSNNVGIGTVSPGGYKLNVAGTLNVTGAANLAVGLTVGSTSSFAGTIFGKANLHAGYNIGADDVYLQMGATRTGSGTCQITMYSHTNGTYPNGHFVINRASGDDGTATITHHGTGAFTLSTPEGANIVLDPSGAGLVHFAVAEDTNSRSASGNYLPVIVDGVTYYIPLYS